MTSQFVLGSICTKMRVRQRLGKVRLRDIHVFTGGVFACSRECEKSKQNLIQQASSENMYSLCNFEIGVRITRKGLCLLVGWFVCRSG